MEEKSTKFEDVLVIGAGIAGMEAALQIAQSERKVYLVEKKSYIGGNAIKYEEVFPNMECSTCMCAPMQQDLLQNENIILMTLAEVIDVDGSAGKFTVKVRKNARYVDLDACIGCDMCFEPCPVAVKNNFEEGLSERKAIFTPCAGSLPNVPCIDKELCLRFKGEDCNACKDACQFEAINFDQKGEDVELEVGGIIVATGFSLFNKDGLTKYGYKKFDNVYNAFEFERLFATNGPTEGEILLKDGSTPASAAVIHCVGRTEKGYCSGICCMYSLKFGHYLKKKMPEIKIIEFYQDLCIPGKAQQRFLEEVKEKGVELVHYDALELSDKDGRVTIDWTDEDGTKGSTTVDMVILSSAIEPGESTGKLSEIMKIPLDEHGFYKEEQPLSSTVSLKEGVFAAGCAMGPKDIQVSVSQADAAVGAMLSYLEDR
jgi:heterodisulfide reductase subunit A